MEKLILFGILSFAAILISWRNLVNIKSHGFYRLFSWIGIIWLFSSNYTFWFHDPFSTSQVVSWILLLVSAYMIIIGAIMLVKIGKPSNKRDDNTLFKFEKTTGLIDTGLYKYIRHPIYSSLIYLAWGIFFKNTSFELLAIASLSTVFLYFTAKLDEKECILFFKDEYKSYMKRSKMFIPYIF
jgi:protein-S-isoprenylcysteine O-methyltransferase Ste14